MICKTTGAGLGMVQWFFSVFRLPSGSTTVELAAWIGPLSTKLFTALFQVNCRSTEVLKRWYPNALHIKPLA